MPKWLKWIKYILPVFIFFFFARRSRAGELDLFLADAGNVKKSNDFLEAANRPEWTHEQSLEAAVFTDATLSELSERVKRTEPIQGHYLTLASEKTLLEIGKDISQLNIALSQEIARRIKP